MKKILIGLLFLLIAGMIYISNFDNKIPFLYPVTVDALVEIGEGIEEKGISIIGRSAEGNPDRFKEINDFGIATKSPIIVTVGVEVTNDIFSERYNRNRPYIIASAISIPQQLIFPKDTNITIISDISKNPKLTTESLLLEATEQLKLNSSHIGILTNKGEDNSIGTAKIFEKAYTSIGSKISYGYITEGTDIAPVVESLLSKGVTILAIPHDKILVNNASIIVNLGLNYRRKIPVVSLDDGSVKKHGVLFSISTDYKELGNIVAEEIKKINSNKKKSGINLIHPSNIYITINPKTVKKLQLSLNKHYLENDYIRF